MSDNNLEEYKTLRGETDQIFKAIDSCINWSITSTASLLGFGFIFLKDKGTGYGLFFLLPLIVIMPLFYYVSEQYISVIRISTYSKNFLELELNLNWERRLELFRNKSKKKFEFGSISTVTIFSGLGVLCETCAWFYIDSQQIYTYCILSTIIIFFLIIEVQYFLHVSSIYKYEEINSLWEEVKIGEKFNNITCISKSNSNKIGRLKIYLKKLLIISLNLSISFLIILLIIWGKSMVGSDIWIIYKNITFGLGITDVIILFALNNT